MNSYNPQSELVVVVNDSVKPIESIEQLSTTSFPHIFDGPNPIKLTWDLGPCLLQCVAIVVDFSKQQIRHLECEFKTLFGIHQL